jgi:chromate transporter
VAALSFGGPAGQIAVMHRILVEEKGWIGERRFLHALNFCMILPGPEAQQLATYIGWLMHRTVGGLIAGGLFILPGAIAIMALSVVYALYGQAAPVEAVFFGLRAAVLAVVIQAVLRIGGRILRNGAMVALAAAAFVLIHFFAAPFPLIVLCAGLIGFLGAQAGRSEFLVQTAQDADADAGDRHLALLRDPPAPGWGLAARTALPWLMLWLAPVAALLLAVGPDNVFSRIALFFSGAAVVTFGGAYAVLAYVAQQAVETHGWLAPGEMLDGLGMAETTPGPLIMVLQFVGFMGAFRDPGALPPLLAGALGGLLAAWVTFAPCFLWIFTGAPLVERLRGARALNGAMSAITAAVVGVVLNLAVWFGVHTMFGRTIEVRSGPLRFDAPDVSSLDPVAAALAALAALALFRFRLGMIATLAGAAVLGLAIWLIRTL